MKRVAIMMAVVLAAVSCSKIEGRGDIVTVKSDVKSSANEISVSTAITLRLSDQMPEGEISIMAYENIHKYIIVSNDRDELSIRLKNGNYKDLDVEVVVSSLQYNDINASGASSVYVDGAAAAFDNYSIDLSGASTFRGSVDVTNTLSVDLSGSSKVKVSGAAARCKAKLSGESSLYDDSFMCRILDVDMSGTSKIRMSVSESISGEMSGASSLKYKGSPSLSVETSGAATVGSL